MYKQIVSAAVRWRKAGDLLQEPDMRVMDLVSVISDWAPEATSRLLFAATAPRAAFALMRLAATDATLVRSRALP